MLPLLFALLAQAPEASSVRGDYASARCEAVRAFSRAALGRNERRSVILYVPATEPPNPSGDRFVRVGSDMWPQPNDAAAQALFAEILPWTHEKRPAAVGEALRGCLDPAPADGISVWQRHGEDYAAETIDRKAHRMTRIVVSRAVCAELPKAEQPARQDRCLKIEILPWTS